MGITGSVHVESGVIQCQICIRKLCLDAALYDDLFFFEFFFIKSCVNMLWTYLAKDLLKSEMPFYSFLYF